MANFYCCGSIPMKPDTENENYVIMNDDERTLEIPKIHYTSVEESDGKYPLLNWNTSGVHIKKGNRIIMFGEVSHNDVLVQCEDGEQVWVDANVARSVGSSTKDIIDVRMEKEYSVVEYDFDRSEKTAYKVLFEETMPIDEQDRFLLEMM